MMDPSKKQSFEDRWKKAFDEASVPPPAQAWESIEARLDLEGAEPTFEGQWKQAFDQASVELPAGAWKGIEERLEKDDEIRIVPLWWRSPRTWLAAASVAAVLVVGGMWMRDNQGKDDLKQSLEIATAKRQAKPSIQDDKPTKINGNAASQSNETHVAAIEPNHKPSVETIPRNEHLASVPAVRQNAPGNDPPIIAQNKVERGSESRNAIIGSEFPTQKSESVAGSVIEKNETGSVVGPEVALNNDKDEFRANEVASVRPTIQAELIPVSPYKSLGVFVQQRYVFYQEKERPATPLAKKHREYWAGVGLMPGSFNPDVNLKTAPSTFQLQSYASQKSVTGKNDPGLSYAMQTQGGVRISKHWSVETGVSYLQGNSNYEGGGYLLDASTNGFSNVLENALADVSYANKNAGIIAIPGQGQSLVNNAVYIDVSKQIRNDYRYVQLPVQAGFTLNPEGKLSYSVLGGMMANFFVNNELESANGNVIKTTPSDEVYRGLNWAATTGLRFNYRISEKWRAMLTGSYQKAVTSGFRANQNLESHPYLYGVSWGMRYSF